MVWDVFVVLVGKTYSASLGSVDQMMERASWREAKASWARPELLEASSGSTRVKNVACLRLASLVDLVMGFSGALEGRRLVW